MIYVNEFAPQLGNRLFQLAAATNLASRNMDTVYLPPSWKYNHCFENFKVLDATPHIEATYQEPAFNYHPIPYQRNLQITGYFQSEKYFIDSEREIRNLFKIGSIYKNAVNDSLSRFLNSNRTTCSIHVRRGDYLKMQEHHPVQDMSYYRSAISLINYKYDRVKFFIFSDDLDWCKNEFPDSPDFAIMDCGVIGDFTAMSTCDHNIIANSSFSWWAAWLNENKNKTVIAPKKWFGPAYYYHNTQDLIPDSWITL